MEVLRCRHRRRLLTLSFATVAFLLLASVPALGFSTAHQFMRRILGEEGEIARRRLGGPGSWPPSCRAKCGWCAPCKAVHVPIQPGMSMPLEYYPEAWRCKCGNKLFMP
ncbi:EPIDERMAL PATTERNING FACTOR-like protein 4 [Andrographis paniculata]|uniref:EPIDERMAL PATTERNING FACTOR-like protein 4 n=1 Tax=Andrographis paniculata TaxID=175694 RepID=UPI0021E8B775|nr:EPIDERMAL PATTERNING FACTOR-like protein 4 [Andrographis paniculata]